MNARLKKLANNIYMHMQLSRNINMGFGWGLDREHSFSVYMFSVFGFEYSGLRFLSGILRVREMALSPLKIDNHEVRINGR